MLDIPVKVLDDAETTVAGAALFGWYGVGEFNSPEKPVHRFIISTVISTRKLNLNL
ncbi:hypothetical protein ACLK17_16935 [Escherichia coli]